MGTVAPGFQGMNQPLGPRLKAVQRPRQTVLRAPGDPALRASPQWPPCTSQRHVQKTSHLRSSKSSGPQFQSCSRDDEYWGQNSIRIFRGKINLRLLTPLACQGSCQYITGQLRAPDIRGFSKNLVTQLMALPLLRWKRVDPGGKRGEQDGDSHPHKGDSGCWRQGPRPSRADVPGCGSQSLHVDRLPGNPPAWRQLATREDSCRRPGQQPPWLKGHVKETQKADPRLDSMCARGGEGSCNPLRLPGGGDA